MSLIQIRNVPDDVHRVLKRRAVDARMTLSNYLLRELTRLARQPSLEATLARIESRSSSPTIEDAADAIRAERTAR